MNKLHDQATPEEISTHLNELIPKAKADASSYRNPSQDEIKEIISYPNFSKDNFNQIYSSFSSPEDVTNHHAILKELSNTPNWSTNHANESIKSISQSKEIPETFVRDLADKHADLDLSPIEQRAEKDINDDSIGADDTADYDVMNFKPEFYFNLLTKKPEHYLSETHQDVSPEQKQTNNKALKHSRIGLQGLIQNKKHTPESLQGTLDILMDENVNKFPKNRFYQFHKPEEHQFDSLTEFVQKQNGLSKDQLNAIYQKAEGRQLPKAEDYHARSRHDELPEAILAHKNVDPMLLAKIARLKPEGYRDSKVGAALANPQLPHEVINGILQNDEELDDKIYGISENPSLTKEHLNTLAEKGYKQVAIQHPNADEELHSKVWENTDKGTDAARDMLKSNNLPPAILKELVNHKNKNVAIDALSHKNVNEEVLDSALSRKAKDVQDAARKHPLVADKELKKGFLEGKVKLSDVLGKKQESEHFSKLSPEEKGQAYEKISQKLKGTSIKEIEKNSKEDPDHIFTLKYHLATSPDVPESIRNQHADDIVESFDTPHNSTDFEFGYNKPNVAKYKAFNKLVENGNKKAEESALNKIGYLMNINRHFRDEKEKSKISPSFLNKAFEKVSNSKGQELINSHGFPSPIDEKDISDSLKDIAKFPGLSEENFDKYLKLDPAKSNSERYLYYGRRANDGTLLDARYRNLPEDEKRQKFSKYLNPVQAFAVAASNDAPQDMRDQAFEMLEPNERHELVNEADNNLVGFSSNILKNALLGKYDNPNEGQASYERTRNQGASSYEAHALSLLDHSSPEHKDALDIYLTNLPNKQFKPSDSAIADKLGDKWLTSGADLLKKHSQSHPELYLKSVNSLLKQEALDLYGKSATEKDAHINNMVDYLQNEAKDFSAGSTNPQEATSQFWENVLRNYGSGTGRSTALGKILDHGDRVGVKPSNGKLDFLADLGKTDDNIKQLLLSQKILSKPKQEELASTFSNYGSYLDSLPTSERHSAIAKKLNSWKAGEEAPANENIEHLVNRINPEALIGKYFADNKTKRMPEEDLKEFDQNLKTLHKLTSDTLKSNALSQELIEKALNIENPKDKEHLASSLFDSILETADPEEKSNKVRVFNRAMKNVEDVPPKVLGKIADYAFENKDIKAITSLYRQHENLPKSVSNKLTNLIQNSQDLDPENILSFASIYGNEKITASNIKKIDFAFEQSLQKYANSPEEESILRKDYIDRISETDIHSDVSKMQFLSSVLQKYSTFPETKEKSVRILQEYLKSDSLPDKDKKNIYLSLPEENTKIHIKLPELSRNLANDSEILEKSTSGWKLDSLINSMDNMNNDTLSILVNRVVLNEDPNRFSNIAKALDDDRWKSGKDYILDKLVHNSATKHQDITKLLRSLPDEEVSNYLEIKTSKRGYNFLEGHAIPILNHITGKLSDLSENPQKYSNIVDSQSFISELTSKISTLSSVFRYSKIEEDMTSNKELLNSYSNSIKTICDANHKILDSGIDQDKMSESISNVINSIKNIRLAQMPINSEDVLNTFSVLKKVQEKKQSLSPDENEDLLHNYSHLAKKGENIKPEVWSHLAGQHPEYPYFLHGMNITKEMIDPIDLNQHLEKNPGHFAEHIKGWFNDMDATALETHGPKIMESLTKKISPKEKIELPISHAIHEGLRFGSRFMNAQSVKQVLNKLPETEKGVAEDICIENGTGGQELINDLFKASLLENGNINYDNSSKFLQSPLLTDEMAQISLKSFDKGSPELDGVMSNLINNKYTSNKIIDDVANKVIESVGKEKTKGESMEFLTDIVKHPKVSYKKAKQIYEMTNFGPAEFISGKKFHPIFSNPVHGSKFLRELPAHVPENLSKYGISPNKMQRDILIEGKGREKIYEAIKNIPAEGIAWPEFKRKFPKYENIQEVKSVFMGKNNKPAVPEDFTHLLAEADEKDKFNSFHITFSEWDSNLQVHNKKAGPNLVVQLNTSQKADEELSKDPKVWALYQHILKHSNGISGEKIGLHPTTPHLISWSRVDASNKDAWIIEEFQSDAAQKFRKNVKSMLQNSPSGLNIDGKTITPDEIKKFLSKIDESFANWQKASMEAVIQNAKAHGIKKVYVHGHGIRSEMSGSGRVNGISGEYNKNHINPRIKEIYDGIPEKYGFKKCDYTDYPNYNPSLLSNAKKLGLPTHCWYLDIA